MMACDSPLVLLFQMAQELVLIIWLFTWHLWILWYAERGSVKVFVMSKVEVLGMCTPT